MTQERLPAGLDLASVFAHLAEQVGDLVWLDSAKGHPELGRRSMLTLAVRPALEITAEGLRVWDRDGYMRLERPLDVWERADALLREARANATEPALGWVGYVAYEAAPLADPGLPAPRAELPFSPVRFDRVSAAILVDEDGPVLAYEGQPQDLTLWHRWIREATLPTRSPMPKPCVRLISEPDPREHQAHVAEIIGAIEAGRVYQACYTFPIYFERPSSLADTYLDLRRINAGDYGAYLRLGRLEAASSSPERYLTVEGQQVRARPMKGTRPRIPGREEALRTELRESVKDQAENVMIVDLLRNDIGRVCEIGSVHVPSLFEIETYETVFQMTSTIEGRLQDDVDVFSLIQATFPPGSMTGAPKVEACRLLDELEPAPRGLYSGSIAWLGYDGRSSMSVVIRTLQAYGDTARWDVGGGIVADSTPHGEWEEALIKATPIYRLSALAVCGGA